MFKQKKSIDDINQVYDMISSPELMNKFRETIKGHSEYYIDMTIDGDERGEVNFDDNFNKQVIESLGSIRDKECQLQRLSDNDKLEFSKEFISRLANRYKEHHFELCQNAPDNRRVCIGPTISIGPFIEQEDLNDIVYGVAVGVVSTGAIVRPVSAMRLEKQPLLSRGL